MCAPFSVRLQSGDVTRTTPAPLILFLLSLKSLRARTRSPGGS